METYVLILGVGQILTAGLLLHVVFQLIKTREVLSGSLKSIKLLAEWGIKTGEMLQLIAKAIDEKKKK